MLNSLTRHNNDRALPIAVRKQTCARACLQISSSRAHLLHLSSGNLAPGHHKKYKLQKSKSRKALQQQQSKRSSIPSSTAAESFTKKPEANTPHEDEDDRGTINSRKRVPSSAGEDEEEVDDSGDSTGNGKYFALLAAGVEERFLIRLHNERTERVQVAHVLRGMCFFYTSWRIKRP